MDKVVPVDIQNEFLGDFYLCCPKCKHVIIFPFGSRNPPEKCKYCNSVFDWEEYSK